LSTLACALIFLGRASTREQDRNWFLRLAAGAAESYLGARGRSPASPPSRTEAVASVTERATTALGGAPPKVAGAGWLERLCAELPRLRRRAAGTDDSAALEGLVTEAKLGNDMSDDFVRLLLRLGGPDDGGRLDLPGVGMGRPVMAETYVCRRSVCSRLEVREPSGPVPRCHLDSGDMIIRTW
jgi:hypothetical protein